MSAPRDVPPRFWEYLRKGQYALSGDVPTAGALAADVVNNNGVANTMQDVTGLSFPVLAGQTYWFRFAINYTAAS